MNNLRSRLILRHAICVCLQFDQLIFNLFLTHTYFYFRVSTNQVERMRISKIHSSRRTLTSSQTSPVNAGGTNVDVELVVEQNW